MIDLGDLFLFALVTLSINLTPGPDMIYVLAQSMGQGRLAGVISACGLSVGYIFYTLLAASGLAAIMETMPVVYNVIRVAGAVYLAYLGIRTLLQKTSSPLSAVTSTRDHLSLATPIRKGSLFKQGALTSTLNPSIAIFFLSFLPQFVDLERGTMFTQIVVLGLYFCLSAVAVYTLLALLTGTAGDWLRQHTSSSGNWLRWTSGVVLIMLGVRVLFQI